MCVCVCVNLISISRVHDVSHFGFPLVPLLLEFVLTVHDG